MWLKRPHRRKRAGRTGLGSRYKGFTQGPGGLKCPCCSAIYNASRHIRRKEKQKLKKEEIPD